VDCGLRYELSHRVIHFWPIGAVRRSEVQAWVKKLSEKLAPGSVELAYRCRHHLQGGGR
jgi:hypothetical protein